jgi:GDP-4-dehydro-6-deoxy-D-mannose reductase
LLAGPRRALITGVTGFAGGYLAELLLEHGWQVLGTSPQGQWERFSSPKLFPVVPLLPWDFADQGAFEKILPVVREFRPTTIFHLAALSIPEKCGSTDPTAEAWQINVEGTRQVLSLAGRLNPIPHLLFVSSSHVYAPVQAAHPFVNEAHPTSPHSAYGKTKLAGENLCRQAAEQGFPAIIVRAFHHSGPRQQPPMLLPQWAKQFADPLVQEVAVYTLNAKLDLCDVRDVVRAYQLLVETEQTGIFNVGSGRPVSTGELYHLFVEVSGRNLPAREIRPGERQEPIACIKRIQETTGWKPQIPPEQTISDTLAWWREYLHSRTIR